MYSVLDQPCFGHEGQGGIAYTAAGHYLDHYRKEKGKWRFAKRQYHSYHYVPLAEGWKQ